MAKGNRETKKPKKDKDKAKTIAAAPSLKGGPNSPGAKK